MKKQIAISVLSFIFLGIFQVKAQENSTNTMSTHQIEKWYKKKEWLNGLKLKPHKSVNNLEFYRQYQANKSYWDKAFAFLKNQDLSTIAKGKYPIDGENVYASVTMDSTKDFNKTNWESHRKYVDLQHIIDGEEKIGVVPIAEAKVKNEYNEKKEVANYTADGKFYLATPGTFFLFFPSDVHRPSISPRGNKPVKKIVIKIKAA